MMILFDVLLSIIVPFVTMDDIPHFSQSMVEICDNGVDDDGDGLIDLNDTLDCTCEIEPSPLSLIPNPSFEDTLCCPIHYSQLDCAANWIQASNATSDYFNECDFSTTDLTMDQPPPDGSGAVGFFNAGVNQATIYKEYVGTCLSEVMTADIEYRLEFYLGFGSETSIHRSSSPTEIVIFGSGSCISLPFSGLKCPIGQDDWMELGSAIVEGNNEWVEASINFTPIMDINAIVIGPNCSVPGSLIPPDYYYLDNLILSEFSFFETISSFTAIENCGIVELHSDYSASNIMYQWYTNGVAILGAMDSVLLIDTSMLGEYQLMVSTSEGCSISEKFTYEYIVPNITSMLDTSICNGQSVMIGNESFDQTGVYTVELTTQEGCDSTVVLDLNVIDNSIQQIDTTTCNGNDIDIGGNIYSETGEYEINIPSSSGCDSIINLSLLVWSADTTFVDTIICHGEQIIIDNQIFDQSGSYFIELVGNNTCDSVVQLNLAVVDDIISELDTSICNGQVIDIGGNIYSETGQYQITIPYNSDCDSIVNLSLQVWPTDTSFMDTVICRGEQIIIDNQVFDQSGSYTIEFIGNNTCDSIVQLDLAVMDDIISELDTTICSGQVIDIDGNIYAETGQYQITIPSNSECDSIINLSLQVSPTDTTLIDTTICSGEQVIIDNQVFDQSGSYFIELIGNNTCDSIVQLDLAVVDDIISELDTSICNGQIIDISGNIYSETGQYEITIPSNSDCDSIVNLSLQVWPTDTSFMDTVICRGEQLIIDNQIFDQSGSYFIELIGNNTCDSIVHIDLEVVDDIISELDTSICNGQIIDISGNIYSETGQYEITIPSNSDCDSIVNLSLQVWPADTSFMDTVICRGEQLMIDNQVFDQSGSYSIELTGNNACDSIVQLDLAVMDEIISELDTTICSGQVIDIDGNIYSETGQYQVTIPSNSECDSIVNLSLQVSPTDTTLIDTTICSGEQVMIDNQVFDQSGSYTIELIGNNVCGSIVQLDLAVMDEIISELDTTICSGQVIDIDGNIYSETGQYQITIPSNSECDSIINLSLQVSPTDTTIIDTIVCSGEQVIIDNQIFDQSGSYTIDLIQADECNRVIILDLMISSGYIEIQASPNSLVLGDSVLLNIDLFDISNPTNIQWTGLMMSCQDCLSQYVTPLAENTIYGVTLQDSNGCLHESSIHIETTQNYYVPNAFTPNGDGLNDYFTVYSDQSIETIETMLIYNRWGDLIFDASNIVPNNEPQGWNGQYKGQDQGSGVYVYMVRLQDRSGKLIQIEGDVTLIR